MSYLDKYINAHSCYYDESQSEEIDGEFINYTLPSIYNNSGSFQIEDENHSENEIPKIVENNSFQENEKKINSENGSENNFNIKRTDAETINKEIAKNDNIKGRIKRNIKRKIKRKERIIIVYRLKKRNRKKNIPRRKYNTDNIRKKIIPKFFKYLIKKINNELGLMRIKKKFKFLPAKFANKFISEVLNEKDKSKVDFTFGQLISKNIFGIPEKEKLYNDNLKVLNYLRNSNINIIENKRFSQLFREYLETEEFNGGKMDKNENDQNYINRCKNKANEFLNFFNKYYEKQ